MFVGRVALQRAPAACAASFFFFLFFLTLQKILTLKNVLQLQNIWRSYNRNQIDPKCFDVWWLALVEQKSFTKSPMNNISLKVLITYDKQIEKKILSQVQTLRGSLPNNIVILKKKFTSCQLNNIFWFLCGALSF